MIIDLNSFNGIDTHEKLSNASLYLKNNPGTDLFISPGLYNISTPDSVSSQLKVMTGEYGNNPQPVMFNPDYHYDIGFDLDGITDCTIYADDVTFMIDGFMEPVSVRNSKNITIQGLTIDHKRKPYSRGKIISQDGDKIVVKFYSNYPINEGTPFVRSCLCDSSFTKIEKLIFIRSMNYINEYEAEFVVSRLPEKSEGLDIYICHTYHSRPAILIENSNNTELIDVTIHSQPGMGVTAHNSSDISFLRLKVIPSDGELLSTNTDSTHVASCRGKLRYSNCTFIGGGDDTLDVHTYYNNIKYVNGNIVECVAEPQDGLHTQTADEIKPGDIILKVKESNLNVEDEFVVINSNVDYKTGINHLELNKSFGEFEGYLIADYNSVPEFEMYDCNMINHFARGLLIKARKAKIENCNFEGIFEFGIKIACEASWREGIGAEEIVINNCKFINCGHENPLCGGIIAYSESDKRDKDIHKKIIIENCYFDSPKTNSSILIKNTNSVVLKDNIIKK